MNAPAVILDQVQAENERLRQDNLRLEQMLSDLMEEKGRYLSLGMADLSITDMDLVPAPPVLLQNYAVLLQECNRERVSWHHFFNIPLIRFATWMNQIRLMRVGWVRCAMENCINGFLRLATGQRRK